MSKIVDSAETLYKAILGKINRMKAFPGARWAEFEADTLPLLEDVCLKAAKFDAYPVEFKNVKLVQRGKSPTVEFSIQVNGPYVRYRARPVEEFDV